MRRPALIIAITSVVLALSGCGLLPQGEPTFSPEGATPTAPVGTPATDSIPATPTAESSEEIPESPEEIVLTVWTSERVAPSGEIPGGEILLEQLTAFDAGYPDIRVEVYVKRTSGPGSTLAYLRSAPPVAPGVLPDLALLDREALIQAANEDLVVPIGPLLDAAIFAELYPVAGNLGSVKEEFIGLPYVLEMQHAIYRKTLFAQPPNSFEAILESPVPYVFPAGALGSVNHNILLQYMAAAGGQLTDAEGNLTLDPLALTEVLTFYAQAREAQKIDTSLFQITDPATTWAMYRDGQAALVTTTSSIYLADRHNARSAGLSSIPTHSGRSYALVSGYSWVIVTQDPVRQAAVMDLINFLMSPANQGAYTLAAGWLPSQRVSFAVWGSADYYTTFGNLLLNNAQLLPEASVRLKVGVPIQSALEDVLLNNVSPIQAANQAAQMVNPSE